MVYVAFVRSPYGHARIRAIHSDAARAMPGVVTVATGADIARVCQPWTGTLGHFAGMKSPPQYPLPLERACWQGEPVAVVVAETRAQAEDAADQVEVDWQELPALTDPETALDPATPVLHPDLGDNLAFALQLDAGDTDTAFAEAALVVEETFHFGRHTGVTLEPRSLIADYDPSEQRLTAYHATQTPYQMQDVYARHFGLAEENVRVVCDDIGGSFGLKLHVYGEEMATVALSILLHRPVKFIADRLESFVSDIHARDHRVTARLAVSRQGDILALELDDLTGIGAYSVYPRTSAVEGNQVVRLAPSAYRIENYRATLKAVFQTKNVMCQYRAVGHPIAFAVTEGLIDKAAGRLGVDPAEFRARNYLNEADYPHKTAAGLSLERLSLQQCLERIQRDMDYPSLRAEQATLRKQGVHRGIGLCTFVEITNPGPAFYGVGGARISSQDGCLLKLEPSGKVQCAISITEQGQGTETVVAQVVATVLGVPLEHIRVSTGDTDSTPYGGATWASRGAGIGSETALKAATTLKANILAVAGQVLQANPASLDIVAGEVIEHATGRPRLTLAEVGRLAYFRTDTLPPGFHPELTVVRHYVPQGQPFAFTNGIQASYLEVDADTGFVTLLGHWVVEDCGTLLNPQLVEEQQRGGVAQGIGAALLEECVYSPEGQLVNGTLADYLVPLASDLPDIRVSHVSTPTRFSELGVKGAGEAGTAAAPGAVLNAINDALAPLGTRISQTPCTPQRILEALSKA